jgi:hypothetical protein
MTPEANMSQESGSGIRDHRDELAWLSPRLRAALRAHLDLDRVGLEGLGAWLESVLPLLPRPGSEDRDPPERGRAPDRVRELSQALADCSRLRARDHFLASLYYRDNVLLSRRVKALEAVLRTAQKTGRVPNWNLPRAPRIEDDRHYLPPEI